MTTTMNLSPELVLLDQQFADETAAITAAGHQRSTLATMSRFHTEQSRLNHRSRKRGYRFYKYRKA